MELSHFIEQFPQYTFKFWKFTLHVPVSPRELDSPKKLRNFSALYLIKILSVLTIFLLKELPFNIPWSFSICPGWVPQCSSESSSSINKNVPLNCNIEDNRPLRHWNLKLNSAQLLSKAQLQDKTFIEDNPKDMQFLDSPLTVNPLLCQAWSSESWVPGPCCSDTWQSLFHWNTLCTPYKTCVLYHLIQGNPREYFTRFPMTQIPSPDKWVYFYLK